MKLLRTLLAALLMVALGSRPAAATFHRMQIEQVVAGLNGLTTVQAFQLRMRFAFENLVSHARLVVRDAGGMNPVLLFDMTSDVANATLGSRVLIATSDFMFLTSPTVVPDFTMGSKIPDSYLPAGTLTYEDDFGTVYWRLMWGGAAYTGPTTGFTTNDSDGNFGPPFAGPLPSASTRALLFPNGASALSTNNAADYALTAEQSAVFTNNAGTSGTLDPLVGVEPGVPSDRPALLLVAPNPVRSTMRFGLALPREMPVGVRIFDVSGRMVRDVSNGRLSAGRHILAWDAASGGPALANGVYFLDVNAGGTRLTRRLVIMTR